MAIALWFCPPRSSPTYESLNQLIVSLQSLFPSSPVFEPHITITSNLICNNDDDVNKILTSCVASINSIKPLLNINNNTNSSTSNNHTPSSIRLSSDSSYSFQDQYSSSRKKYILPLVSLNGCSIGKKYFRKVVLECTPNKYLYSIAQIMRELYVERDTTITATNEVITARDKAMKWLHEEFNPHVSLLYSDSYSISPAFVKVIQQRIEDSLDVELAAIDNTNNKNQIQSWSFDHIPFQSWGLPGTFKIVRCEGPVEKWEVLGKADVI
ncbi:hypothetical protein TBLA_0B08020 [Henningerozyma blattae CBS 6284]|uniref:2',3'-cyclic-nucleotide 3'-phosphodiesterase n=1 Tax=Henningerozyma blattae (strain ATCC 34711 / CBS 6284 / DSM 70876 / NBRC 10599 / NRRL Y-10934 / UCD 77-7) TaxID=1071380 RepID=I2GZR6_HENB6|nr:hypothetical protein TBLA_0B08020 [Tetrapisispora blattae CBS 6284]CCH59618.1 hypothetical protein TBLA_0B08020 [Tetrapisispora blattae CBS 6284]